jgi:hypothetical protein
MTIGNANRHAESRDLAFLRGGKTQEAGRPHRQSKRGDSRPRLSSGAKLRKRCDEQTQTLRPQISQLGSRCHPEQSEGSMHSARGTNSHAFA